ncbi:FAD-dependent oxidoreductase [Chitinimonas sp.]|uniref:FAD-dependent oxidoreductase n=1 Tax=Chitinimonas sp. TaxID=1934313 RepID=UPI0035AE4FF7
MNQPITIIGSGLAGYNLAREIRKQAADVPLRLISFDSGAFYSKPMLSNALASNKSAAQLAMKTAAQMAAELRAEVLGDTRVTAIDAAQRRLHSSAGEFAYDKLVLALGADTFTPPLAGDGAADVLSVNDLADYARFRERLYGKQRVLLLGAGLIGCEFANDLRLGGFTVELVDLAPWPLSRLLPRQAGERMQQALEAIGIGFHLGVSASMVERAGEGYRITLSNGEVLEADLVLSAVGLRPRIALAQAAGLTVNRGVVVDRQLRSSDPHIYALGDCAEVAGQVLPYVLPIMQSARALGPTLAGTPTEVSYPAMPVVVKTPACSTVAAPPLPGVEGEWQIEADAAGMAALYQSRAGELLGFALLGSATAQRQALSARLPALL